MVPEKLTDERVSFTTDILLASYWDVNIGNMKPGDMVVILGCGPVRLLMIKWDIFK